VLHLRKTDNYANNNYSVTLGKEQQLCLALSMLEVERALGYWSERCWNIDYCLGR